MWWNNMRVSISATVTDTFSRSWMLNSSIERQVSRALTRCRFAAISCILHSCTCKQGLPRCKQGLPRERLQFFFFFLSTSFFVCLHFQREKRPDQLSGAGQVVLDSVRSISFLFSSTPGPFYTLSVVGRCFFCFLDLLSQLLSRDEGETAFSALDSSQTPLEWLYLLPDQTWLRYDEKYYRLMEKLLPMRLKSRHIDINLHIHRERHTRRDHVEEKSETERKREGWRKNEAKRDSRDKGGQEERSQEMPWRKEQKEKKNGTLSGHHFSLIMISRLLQS